MFKDLVEIFRSYRLPSNTKLGPEARECGAFMNEVRFLFEQEKIRAVFIHICNDLDSGGKKRNWWERKEGAKQRWLGKFAGAADYLFINETQAVFIEFKAPSKKPKRATTDDKIEPNQKMFRWWCQYAGVPYRVCYTKQEGMDILKHHNFIID